MAPTGMDLQVKSDNEVQISQIWRQSSAELARHFFAHYHIGHPHHPRFLNGQWTWQKTPLTEGALIEHFRGDAVVGAPTTRPGDSVCRVLIIDLDNHDDEFGGQRLDHAIQIRDLCRKHGLRANIEDSDGCGSLHVHLVFADEVSAAPLHDFGQWIVQTLDIPDAEVFPKQRAVAAGQSGNQVRLPGKHHRKDHWSRYLGDDGGWLHAAGTITRILQPPKNTAAHLLEIVDFAKFHADREQQANDLTQRRPATWNGIHPEIGRIQAALGVVSADDYGAWIRVGMALKAEANSAEQSEAMYCLWDDWSGTSQKYDPVVCESKWRSFTGTGTTIATLFQMADAASPSWRRLEGSADDFTDNDLLPAKRLHARDEAELMRFEVFGDRLHYWNGSLYSYNGVCWQELEDAIVEAEVAHWLYRRFQKPSATHKRDVLAELKNTSVLPREHPLDSWTNTPPGEDGPFRIACQNGLVDPVSGTLTKSDPSFFTTTCLPYAYDPSATCDQFLRVLTANLEDDADRIAIVQEFAGYCLSGDLRHHKCMVLSGTGGNGKSVALAGIKAMLGINNFSSVSLDQCASQFGLGPMLGKRANICDEMSTNKKHAGTLKILVSGDECTVDRKFKSPIVARPTAAMLFSTNTIPKFSETTHGLSRRLLIVPFDRRVPDSERVPGMDSADYWMREAPGILNWAMTGLKRLEDNGAFTESHSTTAALASMEIENCPELAFIRQAIRQSAENQLPKSTVYAEYTRWAKRRNFSPVSEQAFAQRMRCEFPDATIKRIRTGGGSDHGGTQRERAWLGIELVPDQTEAASHFDMAAEPKSIGVAVHE